MPDSPVEKVWRGTREFQRDTYECQRETRTAAMVGSGTLGMLAAVRDEDRLYKMCMRLRGWELAPKKP